MKLQISIALSSESGVANSVWVAPSASLELVRPGGHVVWLGKLPPQRQVALRWGSLMGERRIVSSSYGGARPQRDFPMLVQACLEGHLLLAPYITSCIGLQNINAGIDRLRRANQRVYQVPVGCHQHEQAQCLGMLQPRGGGKL